MSTICSKAALAGAMAALCLAGAGAVDAAMITQPQAPYRGEASFSEILAHQFGGSFTSSGDDYVGSNGVTASLLDEDEAFDFDQFRAEVISAFAGYRQRFGIIDSGGYQNLFDVAGRGFVVNGSADVLRPAGPFAFARDGDMGVLASSEGGDNPFGRDHLIAYEITGLETSDTVLALFFEDQPQNVSDGDYQDLVVEIRGTIVPVPTPATAAICAVLSLGLLARRRRA